MGFMFLLLVFVAFALGFLGGYYAGDQHRQDVYMGRKR